MARTKTRLTDEQHAYLARLADAARARQAAEAAYKEALLAAYEDGRVTQTAIGETLGISTESVRRYLDRNSETRAPKATAAREAGERDG
ncbi:hypothetical protein [Luteipulveratus halotolerans]|uniref:Uncharacterized protein n=1 Tax=Luteipulveratus halotolerans TaxID=1631356 RepID=A0A0L6CKK0_9MICO|nr:hypothetical protein [Luteipulveratus halotolerans]KNX38269.1 hypothetical protein VV01_15780 [Luteipulveratus halotolerans]